VGRYWARTLVKRGGQGGVELFLCGEGTAMEGTAVRGRRCVVREEDDAADRWGRSASEGERASERGLAGGAGSSVSERERSARATSRASGPANGPKGGNARARGGRRRPRHGPDSA
jgi:hypothetical protein